MSEVKRVWISFGEHGDVTYSQDWQSDDPEDLIKSFGDDKFYTYYSFREVGGGQPYVHLSEYDAVVKEREEYRAALSALSRRHDWIPAMGQCICLEHQVAREVLAKYEVRSERP